jgi:hypothetical protein
MFGFDAKPKHKSDTVWFCNVSMEPVQAHLHPVMSPRDKQGRLTNSTPLGILDLHIADPAQVPSLPVLNSPFSKTMTELEGNRVVAR